MRPSAQFTYLNHGEPWPSLAVAPHQMEVDPENLLRLTASGSGVATSGTAVFATIPQPFDGPWSRVTLDFRHNPGGSRTQLFSFSSDDPTPPVFSLSGTDPFASAEGWTPMPVDSPDALFTEHGHYLWLGLHVRSDGRQSPEIEQIRLESGRNTALNLLPSIYALDADAKDVTERFLKQLGVSYEQLEEKIANLPAIFDADAASHEDDESWLVWLADWLSFPLSDAWSEIQSRQYLGGAFDLYGRRGTIPGLRQYLKWYAGVNAMIEDHSVAERLWILGENSRLGFRTALSPGTVTGAILGSQADLDSSHLEREDACGAFDPYAHRFTVWIYCAELTRPGALRDAREILDRETPAHTEYQLCLIEPMMRVGHQARLGIDSIVAGSERLSQLDRIVDGTVLAESPESCGDGEAVVDANRRACGDEEEVS